ncbi:39S ribosomal protein L18, mitochondrial [Orussus abietinus]|uniref:39S ribosomal protein L18, mitochondrial n=1 Tax=Orussus abietinus TaxID=222816 RepID=UPI000626133C|nr:39S ribosomal protein L18, mitochondrial [Orussus abietinus]
MMASASRGVHLKHFQLLTQSRLVHTNADVLKECKGVVNKNRRSLELLRIARKPEGYVLDKPGRNNWHKLVLNKTGRHTTAEVHHYENGPIVSVSTKEWAIKKQIYKLQDTSTYINLGRILANRCLESGIVAIQFYDKPSEGSKVHLFIDELQKNGICLNEPPVYKHRHVSHYIREEKPWEVYE